MLHTYFDKTFCINLNSRMDRQEQVMQDLEQAGILATRFEAVDGRELNLVAKYYHGQIQKYWNSATVGILRTTVNLLKLAKENNYQSILIFEDDVFFHPRITQIAKENMPLVPDDWQLLYFGFDHSIKPLQVAGAIHKVIEGWCCHAYAIRHTMYDRIIELLSKEEKPLDAYYNDIHRENKSYCFSPNVAYQREGYSSNTNDWEAAKL